MIWRKAFESTVSYDEPIPALQASTVTGESFHWPSSCVLLISNSFDGLVEQNVWWKLHAEDFPTYKNVYRVFANLTKSQAVEVDLMIAPSQLTSSIVMNGDFQDLLDPQHSNRCFAAICKASHFVMAVRGLPTEDCWQEFSDRLRSELNSSGSSQNL